MTKLNQNTILNLNLGGTKAVDLHAEALANNNEVRADGGMAQHDIIKQRIRNSTSSNPIKNSDDLYNSIIALKKSGLLPKMLKRAGIKVNYIQEDDIGGVGVGGGGVGAPVTASSMGSGQPMGGGSEPTVSFGSSTMKKIDDCYNAMTCSKRRK